MPTYQYACTACDHAFEQVQSFSDDALTACPECEGRLRKVFNAVGVVFKGSGFYRNDSRSSSNGSSSTESGKKSESSNTDTKSGGDSSSSKSSDSSSGSSTNKAAASSATN